MRRATWLVLCVVAVCVGRLPAQDTVVKTLPAKPSPDPQIAAKPAPEPEIPPAVEKLIEQLGDADFRKRDAAAKELQAMGSKAVAALRKAGQHPDAEVQRRAAALLPTIETAALLAPKRVTIHVKKKTVAEIVAELSKQTGYKVEFWGGNQQQLYDLECDDLPFWEAFDRLCQSAGLVLQMGYGDNILRLNHQESYVPYVNYKGAFRLVANSFSYNRNIDFSALPKTTGGTQRNESLNFGFTVCVEPRIPLMSVGEPNVTEALDNEGRSMVLAGRVNDDMGGVWMGGGRFISRHGGGDKSYCMQTYVNLGRPSEKSRSVKVLKGSVPLRLLADQKPEVVSDDILKAKGQKKQIGPVAFDIQNVTQLPNKQYQVKMGITNNDKDNPNDHTWMNTLYYRIELQDAKGNKYNHYGSSWGSNGMNHVDLSFTYGSPGNAKVELPKKLIYYVWTLVNHHVDFEFKDLPLP